MAFGSAFSSLGANNFTGEFKVGSSSIKDIPLLVDSYDLNHEPPLVIGTNLDTGEKVSVAIKDRENADANKSYTNVRMLAGIFKGQVKRWVRKGGILFMSGAVEKGGYWEANYSQTMSHGFLSEEEKTEKFKQMSDAPSDYMGSGYLKMPASFKTGGKKDGGYYAVLEVLFTNTNYVKNSDPEILELFGFRAKNNDLISFGPMTFTSDKLKKGFAQIEYYANQLAQKGFGYLLRLNYKDENGKDSVTILSVEAKHAEWKNLKHKIEPEAKNFIDADNLTIEIIPTKTFFLSKSTVDDLYGKYEKSRLIQEQKYGIPINIDRKQFLFVETYISLLYMSKAKNKNGELEDLKDPFAKLNLFSPVYDGTRYASAEATIMLEPVNGEIYPNGKAIIDEIVSTKAGAVKYAYSADEVRKANGVKPETNEANSEQALRQYQESKTGQNAPQSNVAASAYVTAPTNGVGGAPDDFDDSIPF